MRYFVHLEWADADGFDTDYEAPSIEVAARLVWDEWSPTGWDGASITAATGGESSYLDLNAPAFESALNA